MFTEILFLFDQGKRRTCKMIKTTDRTIKRILARQILDSRGLPTVEATVTLACGTIGTASVPSGASTGEYEAHELRDGGSGYLGRSVLGAVKNINSVIAPELVGMCADDQYAADMKMIALDGSKNKRALGANALLAVSLAISRATATSYGMPLYVYLGGKGARIMPMPMMNIINGGAHASNNLEIQEFMICPHAAESFADAMKIAVEVYGTLKSILLSEGMSVSLGDEGGFAPSLASDEDALRLIVRAIGEAGYEPGGDVSIAIDAAASEWAKGGKYLLPKSGRSVDAKELLSYYAELCESYPIVSVEDPFSENDMYAFGMMTEKMRNIQIVGDDLFVTNTERLREGMRVGAANAILIKPNQIGTLTETLDAVRLAASGGYRAIISHRSGETEDTAIADIAVALGTGQIKAGAPARGERVCKYNRLLRIEESLGRSALYGIPK